MQLTPVMTQLWGIREKALCSLSVTTASVFHTRQAFHEQSIRPTEISNQQFKLQGGFNVSLELTSLFQKQY